MKIIRTIQGKTLRGRPQRKCKADKRHTGYSRGIDIRKRDWATHVDRMGEDKLG